jgi:hypothetical protein
MPKKAVASKSMELDKKINAIKGEIDQIIEEVETPKQEIEQEPAPEPKEIIVAPEPKEKKQPKIVEEIVEEEEDEEEPIVIKKVVKKKSIPVVEVAPPKVETRGRPRKNVEAPKPQPKIIQRQPPEPYQHQQHQQYQQHRNRFDSDMVLNESSMELLRQDMRNEMKRRLMASLFDC